MELQKSVSSRISNNWSKWLGKRITLMRNGNSDFKGTKIVVSEKKYPNFSQLMDEISKMKVSRLPDNNAVGQLGTRFIYSKEGDLITSISQFQSGEEYICCAAPFLKVSLLSFRTSSILSKMSTLDANSNSKTIFIILAGLRPRTIACLLLMKKLEITYEKLVHSIGEFLNIMPDKIQSIVTVENVKITNVKQFFEEKNSIFVVYMSTKRFPDDLLLSVQELDFINSTLQTQELEKKDER